jgi:hypothetical protein
MVPAKNCGREQVELVGGLYRTNTMTDQRMDALEEPAVANIAISDHVL